MTNIIALSSIYLLMLFAFAEGIKTLTGNDCSDWLASCPGVEVAAPRRTTKDSRRDAPGYPDHRGPAGQHPSD